MKYLLSLVFGLVLGAACASAVVYWNPLSVTDNTSAAGDTPTFRYSLSEPHLLASTHNEFLSLPLMPSSVPLLWESGVRGTSLQVLALSDQSGDLAAVATKLSVPSVESNAVTKGLLIDDYWMITMPGRGSLLVQGQSNIWPLVRDTLLSVDTLGREWAGPANYAPLMGQSGRAALVIGLSGELAIAGGTMAEKIAIDNYSRYGFESLNGALTLNLGHAN
jgi:hypothetical protein